MKYFVGTSGYSYKEWKGNFYPEKLPQDEMLGFYAQRFSTVEINNTFYRMPKESVVAGWAEQVPKNFRFVLKAPQRITHIKRLANVDEEITFLLGAAAVLGKRRGPILFQTPPNLKKDLPRLESFLRLIKGRVPAVFEFRHDSWLDDEVVACLKANKAALCIADVDDAPSPQLVSTSSWGYLRLRRAKYTARDLKKWIAAIRATSWKEAYVFFKHEDEGTGPKFAARFLELLKA